VIGVFGAVGVVGDLAADAADGLVEGPLEVVSPEVEIADGGGCLEFPLVESGLLGCFVSADFPLNGLFPGLLFTGIFTGSDFCGGLSGADDFFSAFGFSAGEDSNAEPFKRDPKSSDSSRYGVPAVVFSGSGVDGDFGAVGSSDDNDALSPSRLEVCSVGSGSVNNG